MLPAADRSHGFDPDTWSVLSIEGGPAFMSPDDSPDTVITQQRADFWMTTRTDDRVVSEVVGAFEAVSFDPTGEVVLQSDDWEVIASFDVAAGSVVTGARPGRRRPVRIDRLCHVRTRKSAISRDTSERIT